LSIAIVLIIFAISRFISYNGVNKEENTNISIDLSKQNKDIEDAKIINNTWIIENEDIEITEELINSYWDINEENNSNNSDISVSNVWWYDYPVDFIITIDNADKIFTNKFVELPNEKDSLWQELSCFEYFDFSLWKDSKTCTSGKYTVEKTNPNL